jgi:hypothetical protein
MSKAIVVLICGSGMQATMSCAAEEESPSDQEAPRPRCATAAAAR